MNDESQIPIADHIESFFKGPGRSAVTRYTNENVVTGFPRFGGVGTFALPS